MTHSRHGDCFPLREYSGFQSFMLTVGILLQAKRCFKKKFFCINQTKSIQDMFPFKRLYLKIILVSGAPHELHENESDYPEIKVNTHITNSIDELVIQNLSALK